MKLRVLTSALIAALMCASAHAAAIVVKDASGNNQTVGALPMLGQATMINSLPFTLASDQPALHVICDSGCAGSGGGVSSAITSWGGGTLGAMANYGTSPGAVLVPGVNAFVTNAVAVTGTFFQATQPVSATSLPLPTGAATAANQSAVQAAAGSSSSSALGVQGVTGGIAVPVTAPIVSSLATNQVSVGTTATLIVAARTGRRAVTIVQEGTTLVRLGGSGVTLSTGVPLPGTQYSAFTVEGGAAVYGIVGTGTQAVSFVETY